MKKCGLDILYDLLYESFSTTRLKRLEKHLELETMFWI